MLLHILWRLYGPHVALSVNKNNTIDHANDRTSFLLATLWTFPVRHITISLIKLPTTYSSHQIYHPRNFSSFLFYIFARLTVKTTVNSPFCLFFFELFNRVPGNRKLLSVKHRKIFTRLQQGPKGPTESI